MTVEEMQKQMELLNGAQQDRFIDNLKDMVNNLCEKSNKKDYKPTDHERLVFEEIRTMLNNMKEWF